MRRVSLSRIVPTAAVCTTSLRQMVVYSENSPVLENNQKARKSPYNAWIEEWELPRLSLVPLPNDSNPTVLMLDKILELYNMDCVQNPPEGLLEAPQHASWQTHKPYGQHLQFMLQGEAVKSNYTSKWWMTRNAARTQNFILKSNARIAKVATKGKVSVFHASQFADPLALQKAPVSGGSRKMYAAGGVTHAALVDAITLNSYRSGLFFTKKQLESFGLDVVPNSVPVVQPVTMSENFKFYNLDQFENPKAILEALGRSPVTAPTFLLSGDRINVPIPPNSFSSMYYLSGRDAELYNFQVLASERGNGIALSEKALQRSEMAVEFFNVDQLQDPARGFTVAGSLAKSN